MLASPFPRGSPFRAQQFMSEFANGLDRPLQILIIAQPTPHLVNTFTLHTEPTRAPSRTGHFQHENSAAFFERASRTVFAMFNRALNKPPLLPLTTHRHF